MRSKVLFGGSLADASVEEILMVFDDVPTRRCRGRCCEMQQTTAELVTQVGLAASKGEATRLIKQGGIYVNDRVIDERGFLQPEQLIDGQVLTIRKGQRDRRIVRVS